MRCRLPAGAVLGVLAAISTPELRAGGPQFWRIEGASAFLEGELHGLSLDSQGRLRLGAAPRQIAQPVAPNAWAIARDASGALFVGTGNDGRVLRLAGGTSTVHFDAEELEVNALAMASDGRLFAATSPDGAVYVIDRDGKGTVFFNPKEKYVWALAVDGTGNLYVATGGEARVYRVNPRGEATEVLTSTDTHILCLAVDRRGRVFAGSAPGGIVYRIGPKGEVFVVLDAPFREIRSLDVAEDDTIYAAAIDARTTEAAPRPAVSAPPAATTPTVVVPEVTVTESFSVVPPSGGTPIAITPTTDTTAASAPKGAILRISESGDVDTLWTSSEEVPHSVLRTTSGVLVGTGDKGKLYRVTNDGEWTLVATLAAEQVTAITRGAGQEEALVATSNPARVYALEGTLASQGTFVSKVKDAEAASRWGRVSWEGRAAQGTRVALQTRSGNTEHPDATWSEWSSASAPLAATAIRSERARFLQIRVTLTGQDAATPVIEAVSTSYLQRNLPPVVQTITVHPPGEVFQKPISVSGDPEILGLALDPLAERGNETRAPASPPAITFSRKMYQRGFRTLSWQASDPNGDPLLFEVQYRTVGDERWRPLRRDLSEPVLAWDTSIMPNGRYLVRVIASDAPGNPASLALTAKKDSGSFEVDNAPPTIMATLEGAARDHIRAVVRDDSPVRELALSLDAGPWQEYHPIDGIADSSEEHYDLVLPPAAHPRVAMLRASDVLGNMAAIRIPVP